MIDINCNILLSVDDGPQNIIESLDLAKMAINEGIHTIVAAPHHQNGIYENTKTNILNQVEEMNILLNEHNLPLTLLPGQVIGITEEILEDLEKNEVLTINESGKYLLIELPVSYIPQYTERLFFDLQMKDIIPVIVHPERNQSIIENPELLYQFVKRGALSQVTASSVTGLSGKTIQKFTLKLIEANLTHFIASEAYNITNRAFHLSEAYSQVKKKFGIDMVDMFFENAELAVKSNTIYKEQPVRVRKNKAFKLF